VRSNIIGELGKIGKKIIKLVQDALHEKQDKLKLRSDFKIF
jgi:hypothetical protein